MPRRSWNPIRKIARTLVSLGFSEWDMRGYFPFPTISSMFGFSGKRETHSGIEVTDDTSMTYSAVWAATTFFSSMAATLPRSFDRLDKDGNAEPAKDHPLYKAFVTRPCPWMSAEVFYSLTVPWLVNQGNIVCVKFYDSAGRIKWLVPVHPSRVHWGKIEVDKDDNKLRYPITNDEGKQVFYHQDDILHIHGKYTRNGIYSEGVIPYGGESIGMGIVTEAYGAKFFANDAHAGTVVRVKDQLGAGAYERLKTSWEEKTGLENAHSPVILEQGAELDRLGIYPEQAQYLQTRKHNITEIARWYDLPVYFLKEMTDSGVRANVESESISLVIYSLLPWLIRIEKAIWEQCLHEKDQERFQARFEVKGLLRGDSAARAAFYKELFSTGAFTPNKILELEDMEQISEEEGGNLRFVPGNLMTIEQHLAVTKQAVKVAEQPLPDPNKLPDNDPNADNENNPNNDSSGSKTPEQNGEQRQNNQMQQNGNGDLYRLLAERLTSPHLQNGTGSPSTNGHAAPPKRKRTSRCGRLLRQLARIEASVLPHIAEKPGDFPTEVEFLYTRQLPAQYPTPPQRIRERLDALVQDRYKLVQQLYELPCDQLKEGVQELLKQEWTDENQDPSPTEPATADA